MNLDLLKTIWGKVYDPKIDTITTIEQFFHLNFKQCINGDVMNRKQFITHVVEQKKNITIQTIDYLKTLENGNDLFAIYHPKGVNNKNQPIEAEVIGYFEFQNEQIINIHGQVLLIKGDSADIDL